MPGVLTSVAQLAWVGLLATGSLALLVAVGLWWLRRSLSPERLGQPPEVGAGQPTPQQVRLPTQRGRMLNAWWLPPHATPAPAAPVVVLMHGWGGNAATLWAAACHLNHAGCAVLLPEARNHGQSDADTFSSLPRFAEDLDAALHWASQQPGVAAGQLVALGHSVGGAAALLSASRRSDLQAVVSVSAFAHPERVMRRWLAARHIPYWPLGWLVNRYVEHVIGHRFADIAPLYTLPQVSCPVLLVHGTRDDVVPLGCAQQLHQQAQAGRATLMAVPGTHESFDNEAQLMADVRAWLLRTRLADSPAPLPLSRSAAQADSLNTLTA